MRKYRRFVLPLLLIVVCSLYARTVFGAAPINISIFNFSTANLEASGYGTSVTNMLANYLGADSRLALLDRKELEAFLSLNDLQQNDNLENVTTIGSRMGLNFVVTGSVQKKGPLILIQCTVIQVEQKRVLLATEVKSLGDAGLGSELQRLAAIVSSAVSKAAPGISPDSPSLEAPLNVQKRSGQRRVSLSWEEPPGQSVGGYEVFRSQAEAGPFARIAQVKLPRYLDQGVERNTAYYYKIRSFDAKGLQSGFSAVISAETAPTPNPPIILKTEPHVKGVRITWAPAPIASDDPLRLKGYKLYRAKVEQGQYQEVGNILGKDLAIGMDAGVAIDKIFKITFMDKGLADGEDYFYRVTAYNEKNLESDFSRPVKGSVLRLVSGLAAEGNMIREIKLTWKPLDSPFVLGYYVYRSTAEGGNYAKIKKIDAPNLEEGGIIQYRDQEGLGDSIRYYYRVTAVEDPETETSPSATVSAVTRGKPATPEGFRAKSGLVKKVALAWTAASGDDVEGYKIYVRGKNEGKPALLKTIEGRASSGYVDQSRGFDNLADHTAYSYRITTYNRVGVESEPSGWAVGTTKPRPARPVGFTGDTGRASEAPLRWQPNPEGDIALYHIYRSATGDGDDFSHLAQVQGGLAYVDKGLNEGSTYRYQLQAEDRDGLLSDYSEVIAVKTKPKPRPPAGLSGKVLEGNVALSWTPGREPDISYYTVYEKGFFGLEKLVEVKESRFRGAGPDKGNSKTYAVTATDKDGLESDPSPAITVKAAH